MLRSFRHVIAPGWRELLARHRLDSVEGIYGSSSGDVITQSGTTEVRRVQLPTDDGSTQIIFIKKYWIHGARQLWSGFLRGTFLGRSKARREFENLAQLRRWGLDAPEPIAYGEERRGRCLIRSYLISAGVPNPFPLDLFVRDRLRDAKHPDSEGRRRALIDALADVTHRLHEHRFVHHDYFWRNLILSGERLDHFWMIDAHKGRRWHWFAEQNRAADLAALDSAAVPYFRRTERLRFFLRYCGRATLDDKTRRLLRATLRQAEPMRQRQLRRVIGTKRPAATIKC